MRLPCRVVAAGPHDRQRRARRPVDHGHVEVNDQQQHHQPGGAQVQVADPQQARPLPQEQPAGKQRHQRYRRRQQFGLLPGVEPPDGQPVGTPGAQREHEPPPLQVGALDAHRPVHVVPDRRPREHRDGQHDGHSEQPDQHVIARQQHPRRRARLAGQQPRTRQQQEHHRRRLHGVIQPFAAAVARAGRRRARRLVGRRRRRFVHGFHTHLRFRASRENANNRIRTTTSAVSTPAGVAARRFAHAQTATTSFHAPRISPTGGG
ncbi:MAG: hypothetical protein BIFFINMI_02115 [Phycisphaerae bacterium]|nr:hypothetical protein [Phycisphaerae bacterium]